MWIPLLYSFSDFEEKEKGVKIAALPQSFSFFLSKEMLVSGLN